MNAPERQVLHVVYFAKPCPRCGEPLEVVRKFGGAWWWDCETCGRWPEFRAEEESR